MMQYSTTCDLLDHICTSAHRQIDRIQSDNSHLLDFSQFDRSPFPSISHHSQSLILVSPNREFDRSVRVSGELDLGISVYSSNSAGLQCVRSPGVIIIEIDGFGELREKEMDWFSGRVSLGNLDIAGAVNKISESVKNIEKNFDSALGLEEKPVESSAEASGAWQSAANRKTLFDPVMAFMGQRGEEENEETKSSETIVEDRATESESLPEEPPASTQSSHSVPGEKSEETVEQADSVSVKILLPAEGRVVPKEQEDVEPAFVDGISIVTEATVEEESDSHLLPTVLPQSSIEVPESLSSVEQADLKDTPHVELVEEPGSSEATVVEDQVDQSHSSTIAPDDLFNAIDTHEKKEEQKPEEEHCSDGGFLVRDEALKDSQAEVQVDSSLPSSDYSKQSDSLGGSVVDQLHAELPKVVSAEVVSDPSTKEGGSMSKIVEGSNEANDDANDIREGRLSSASNVSDSVEAAVELEKLKKDTKLMEAALHGAARQAQAKADEIARLLNENEHLKVMVEDLRRKSSEAEIESLREEYHQRVATLERKMYAVTKERDTLRRDQSKKSDAAALLKEKDEIISQVMAEGEELSKKQAAQEATIRKLRAQIRELEEEKKGLATKLQIEENKVESIKKDKAATEKVLQETIEKHQAELAAQKDYYTAALNAAKEAEALSEARANNEARTELEGRLREAEERETILVQAIEELRQTLSRSEQQANFKEDALRRDIEDLQNRYQASERRCEELVMQLPESTRPLLRQIEAMQEITARKAEAWAAVEKSLESRLQEAEAKTAAAEEKERSINERLSQTLSRVNVLEAQISCLRAEQTQLTRSIEKERQRAAEIRQEYLTKKEEADTQEGRANQLEKELKELKRKHKEDLQESLAHRELLQQELERERTARLDLERTTRVHSSAATAQATMAKQNTTVDNGKLLRKLSAASSVDNMTESFFLQASLESSDNLLERRNSGDKTMSPYYLRSMTPSAFEATLRQKEGELSSYMSRLASMESIRDSLAEELVKMTEQCEKLRIEAAVLPSIKAELEALRRRHTAALELMGERDEELEELRNDIVDLKEMYREQVNMLVNKV
ncbi:Golgin putative 5-like protein [Drosera capensis]